MKLKRVVKLSELGEVTDAPSFALVMSAKEAGGLAGLLDCLASCSNHAPSIREEALSAAEVIGGKFEGEVVTVR